MSNIIVNDARKKALHWWRSLNNDMKFTMVQNPEVNKTEMKNVNVIGRSSIQVQRMFINWLSWKIED